ncbi:hypothetical protein [Aeribacillus composti]|uniref:hypothetical protein n=1 Tax=Aeribacillus composti TaxID=1868734 RepID=UPI0011A83F77|nr:hypothetical protein [Aeribacillus composti]
MFQFSMKDRYHFAADIVLLEIERREFLKRKQRMAFREIYFFANMVSGHCAKNASNPDKALLQKDHSNIESMSLTSKKMVA